MTLIGHCTAPALNLSKKFSSDRIANCRSNRQVVRYDLPLPISKEVLPLTADWTDLCRDIVESKLEHVRALEVAKYQVLHIKQAERWLQHLEVRKELNTKMNVYPKTIVDYAELMERDPDPWFTGKYNWYLMGGNVAALEDQQKSFIVRSFGDRHQFLGKFQIYSKN